MRVSVLMPVFNGANHVADAVASVQQQRDVEVELLVHDDGSTDETRDVLARLARRDARIDVSRGRNQGPAASRNHLLRRARGEYIAFLDHDDVWTEGRLARQLAVLEAAPAAPGVLGQTLILLAPGTGEVPPPAGGESRRELAGLLQAGLFRRSAVVAAGRFDPTFVVADDFDFLLRLIESCGPLAVDPEIAVCYRLRQGRLTNDLELTGRGTAHALARSLQRRRAAGAPNRLKWRASAPSP